MPLPPSAPYDTLATVTAQTRILLGDFIQGIQPNVSGTVDTNGLTVTWKTGNKFTALLNGVTIIISNVPFLVVMVTSPTSLQLLTSAGVQAGAAYSAVIPTGDIFSDSQAYVLPTINLAWRKLKKKLVDKNHPRLVGEAIVSQLPISGSTDPAAQQWISWTQFFDGANLTTTPVLPPDFESPLELGRRLSVSSGTNFNKFSPMHPAPDSLMNVSCYGRTRYWDWRNDALYFYGSLYQIDLYLRYQRILADIAVAGGGFGSTPIPIIGCAEALANYAAAYFVTPRGGSGEVFEAAGDIAVDSLTLSNVKLQQRSSYSRKRWGRPRAAYRY